MRLYVNCPGPYRGGTFVQFDGFTPRERAAFKEEYRALRQNGYAPYLARGVIFRIAFMTRNATMRVPR